MLNRPCMTLVGVLSFCIAGIASNPDVEKEKPQPIKSPVSPAESKKHIRLDPGLRLELVASEPLITSPVAMTFDENGKLWVVEMRDYPNGPAPGKPPEGRIRVLHDDNNDGRYDRSTIFADNLLFANGILRWKDGVIVTAAPHVVFLRDTNGDGKADKREVLYKGFAAQNPQLRVSHPILGIDNWIYVSNGLRGGQVVSAKQPNAKPINLSGMDFRFDPITGRHEAISGMGQYGNTFDDWGNRFVCDNRHHLRQIVMPNRYVRRNPFLAVPSLVEDISVLEGGPLNSGGKIYPISKNWTTSSLHEGQFTAACGVRIYRGNLLPKTYYGSAFTCDPTGNLVHQEVLSPNGGAFQARPARKGVEFLASPEDWFRPVFLSHGPDGAFYVVDMYRAVIEHPQFMPPELKNRPDLTLGKNRGRIWRIVPNDYEGKWKCPQLGKMSIAELIKLLEHPNAWQRDTAHRLILQRQDKSVVPKLKQLIAKSPSPQARAIAAWMLHSFNALSEKAISQLLKDDHAGVRKQAVRFSEPLLPKSQQFQQSLLAMKRDSDAHVRFQVALSLGAWDDDHIVPALTEIGLAKADDQWTRIAVLTSAAGREAKLLTAVLSHKQSDDARLLLLDTAEVVGARQNPKEMAILLDSLSKDVDSKSQMAVVRGFAQGLERRGKRLSVVLSQLSKTNPGADKQVLALLSSTAQIASDGEQPLPTRLEAIDLLSYAPWSTAKTPLVNLFTKGPGQKIRIAAVHALSSHNEPEIPKLLMKSWRSYTPPLRSAVSLAMMRRMDRVRYLLDELDAGRVKPGDLDVVHTRRLMRYPNADLRKRATKLLKNSLPADRKIVLARYQAALKMDGDAKRGKLVFKKNCATCHRIGDIGVNVAPDIGDTRTKTKSALLLDILNPNQAIDNNYINYFITTKSGKSVTGIIDGETTNSITLRAAEDKKEVILRQDIAELQSTGVSLMPEGLEKNITIQEMADLLVFLKNWRYLESGVPVGE